MIKRRGKTIPIVIFSFAIQSNFSLSVVMLRCGQLASLHLAVMHFCAHWFEELVNSICSVATSCYIYGNTRARLNNEGVTNY